MNASFPANTLKPAQRNALLSLASGEDPELVADRIRAASTLLRYLDRPKMTEKSPRKPSDLTPSTT